jgi:hypothetical protein
MEQMVEDQVIDDAGFEAFLAELQQVDSDLKIEEMIARLQAACDDIDEQVVPHANAEHGSPGGLTLRPPFAVVSSGTCHEIKDADGMVCAWTASRAHALVLAGLLDAASRPS